MEELASLLAWNVSQKLIFELALYPFHNLVLEIFPK